MGVRAYHSSPRSTPVPTAWTHVEVPNDTWHERHTFTCFGFPIFMEEDMQQIAKGLTKEMEAYFMNRHLATGWAR